MAASNKLRDALGQLALGVLFILGACWFWYYLVGNPLDELALIRRAETGPGSILDAWEDAESGDEGGTHWFHWVVYTYRIPDGRAFTQRTKDRSGRLREELQDFQGLYPIEVEYLPDDPAVSRIKGDGCQSVTEWLWRKVGLGCLLLALFCAPGILSFREGVRGLKRARATIGGQGARSH